MLGQPVTHSLFSVGVKFIPKAIKAIDSTFQPPDHGRTTVSDIPESAVVQVECQT